MSVETTQETAPTTPPPAAPETPKHLQEKTPVKWQTEMINPVAPYQSSHPTAMNHFNFAEAAEEGSEEAEAKPEGEENGEETNEETGEKADGENVEDGSEKEGDESVDEKPVETRQERFSKKINEIARRENELRKREKALEARKKAGEELSREELQAKAKSDPLGFMEEFGLSYNEVTKFILDPETSKKKSEELSTKEELALLKKELDQQKVEKAEREAQEKIDQFKSNIRTELSKDMEKYELINANEDYDTVYEVIYQNYQQNGSLLSLDEAASLVENELEKNLQAQLEKLSKTTKVKKWGFSKEQKAESTLPKQATSETVTEVDDQATQIAKNFVRTSGQSPKTITGQMVGQSASIRKRPQTREERVANAARILDAGKAE